MANIFIASIDEQDNRWKRAGEEFTTRPDQPIIYDSTAYTYKSAYTLHKNHGSIKIRHQMSGSEGTATLLELRPTLSEVT